jgi:DNA-nicking Smr family endonuclease
MNPDDKSLFLDAMEDVQSLKRCADIHWQPSRNTRTRQTLNTEQLDNFLTLGFLAAPACGTSGVSAGRGPAGSY